MAKQTKGDLGMYRKSAVAAALFFITVSSDIHALGLGKIDMQSALNQPMNATIELTSAASTDLSKVICHTGVTGGPPATWPVAVKNSQ